jgi:NAD(P)H-hydrate epimerase
MTKILTAEQMGKLDRETTELVGIPSLLLMENAGFQLYAALREGFDDLPGRQVAIVCGKGNNGGDGMVLARQLMQHGCYPDVYLLAEQESVSGDAAVNLGILVKWGCPIFEIADEKDWEAVLPGFEAYDIIVDAILGTGITKPLSGLFARVVQDLNLTESYILAVDIPSGMVSDSVETTPLCVEADATVTFTAPKIAHVLSAGLEALGDLTIASIGTPPDLLDKPGHRLNLITIDDAVEWRLPRPASSHKGTYGHIAVIAGSSGKAGAASLGSQAALRTGSGLVTVLTPRCTQPTVAGFSPEVMTAGFESTAEGSFARTAAEPVLEFLQQLDAAAIGPGLSTHPETADFTRTLVRRSPVPLVVDADGLNAFAGAVEKLRNENGHSLILTPHPGEFSRLTDLSVGEILRNPHGAALDFSTRHQIWLVLKNFRTLVASPDGLVFVSPTGNPGMATAGMGDVLTGILTSCLGRYQAEGLTDPEQTTRAVCLGVFLHGMAADLAAEISGTDSLIAGDVIHSISRAFHSLLDLDSY